MAAYTMKQRRAMSRMSPGRKRAFRKMLASKPGRRRTTRKRRVMRRTRRRNPGLYRLPIMNPYYGGTGMTALVANPRRRRRRRKSTSKRRKRRSYARRPRRRRRRRMYARRPRRTRRRRRSSARRRRGVARVSRGTRVIVLNRRGRRRRSRRRYRRNPRGVLGVAKKILVPYVSGLVSSMAVAVLDTGLAKYPVTSYMSKLLVGAGIVLFASRRYPRAADGALGALGASTGYELGTKLAGGIIIRTPEEAPKGLLEMSRRSQPQMRALLQGMGSLGLSQMPSNVPMVAQNYTTALQSLGDDDDDS